jgi:tRNA G18 (ribose-2'-O)-methylase SpoU
MNLASGHPEAFLIGRYFMSEIIRITGFDYPGLEAYAHLTERELFHPQKGDGSFIAESPNVINRALDAGFEPISLLMEEKQLKGQGKEVIARCGDIPVYLSTLDTLKKLTGFALTRGVLCAMRRKPLPKVEDICRSARRIAILENVMNPTNVGAVFRSAAALNMDAVLLTPGCCDALYRRSVRVSMGTVFQIPWAYLGDRTDIWPEEGISLLHSMGFQTAAMALRNDSIPVDDPRLTKINKLAIILGTEGDGLAYSTIASCDFVVRIPMAHQVDSLNVAAASAVAFWQLGRYS